MSHIAARPPLPYTVIVPTAYGQMILNRNDINQTNMLFKSGIAVDHKEIMLLANIFRLLGPGLTFLDVGANFGCYSLALSPFVGPGGRVHAFEPQRILHNMVAGTMALNSVSNVWCHNVAVGDREGQVEIPQFDYSSMLNFGSVEFGPEQTEALSQQRAHDPDRIEYVRVATIDSFAFPRADVMKVDVEGMELAAFSGAADTIRRCRPVIFVEWIKVGHAPLEEQISAFGYRVHLVGGNLLCVPAELTGLIRIDDPQ
ncbi:MAG TPA: FkbM family methyltransferase [Acetobacteraceae bacterium]|nr:FkbM family methyltransferase [Acetobacteraceae bacterium]